eukprot:jgi/Undpi1/13802/HiC_scaffold_9.g03453.m1
MSAAAVAVRNGPVTTARRTAMPSSLLLKTSSMFRVCSFSTLTDEELRRKMDTFNDLFVTAREEMEFAGESKETTYFDEEAAAAKEAVDEAVALFEEVLSSVTEQKRTEIMRGSGLRVEQLKAELDQLLASDDH